MLTTYTRLRRLWQKDHRNHHIHNTGKVWNVDGRFPRAGSLKAASNGERSFLIGREGSSAAAAVGCWKTGGTAGNDARV